MSQDKGKIKGTIYWYPHRANDNGKYEVNVCNLENKDIKILKELGLPVKDGRESDNENKQAMENFVVLRSKYPPKLVDAKKHAIPDDVGVGNGSVVNVVFNSYAWSYQGKKGIGGSATTVQVLDLVEFEIAGGDEEFLDEEDGFSYDEDDEVL